MAGYINIEVQGLREIQQMFESLPKQVSQKAVWQRFWRKNTKPMLKIAQDKAPKRSGQLKRSIGFFTTRASRRYLGGYIGPRVKGRFASFDKSYKKGDRKGYKKSGFYGAFVEYGGEVMFWGKGPAKKGDQPFMQPAFDQGKATVIKNSIRDAISIVAKAIKTHEARLNIYGKFGFK